MGSSISLNGRDIIHVKSRITQAKEALYRSLLVSKSICLIRGIQKVKSLFWSICIYASLRWNLRKIEKNKLDSFEIWYWKRILKVSWTHSGKWKWGGTNKNWWKMNITVNNIQEGELLLATCYDIPAGLPC